MLYVKLLNDTAKELYGQNEVLNQSQIDRHDAGFDLYYCGEDIVIEPHALKATILKMGIACMPADPTQGYFLFARSSICKTPLEMANSVGIIDAGYRGEIGLPVRNHSNEPFTVTKGMRLGQLCMPDLCTFVVKQVTELTDTARGEGGFGSTGN
jgi:dUTP pyrophosphatase